MSVEPPRDTFEAALFFSMGLTRLAQDPWSESVSVPTFTPPPVEVKSCHVPLTAERAEELVKSHLERTAFSLRKIQNPSTDPTDASTAAASSPACGAPPPGCIEAAADSSSPFDREAAHHLHVLPAAGCNGGGGGGGEENDIDAAAGGTNGGGGGAAQPDTPDAAAVMTSSWVTDAEERGAAEEFTFGRSRASGLAPSSRRPPRPASGSQGPLSRRLSCPENLLNIQDGGIPGIPGGAGPVPEQEDALEPLANHHMWMHNRGRMDGGGQGLLYSAAGVLDVDAYGDGVVGGWQPRDAASIFTVGGGDWDASSGGGAGGKGRTRIGKLMQEGASGDAIRTLAAVIIQSYCRGWLARRRVERMQSLRRSQESRRLKERAAAEALARERETVRRRLRVAAKDCLLAVQAQQDYERTRSRLAAARGLSSGATAAPPPPPPSISVALWERCKALGQDPIAVLLESGLQSNQIEEIIAASQLASQLPRRVVAAAVRMGVPLAPVPEAGSRPGSRSSYGGAPTASKPGSASDDGGSAALAVAGPGTTAAGGLAAAAGRGAPPLARRLSLPGRPLLPSSQRSLAAAVSVTAVSKLLPPPPPAVMNTSQLVEQMLAQQQQTQLQMQQQQPQQQPQQQLSYGVHGGLQATGNPGAMSAGAVGPAVRRSSGPGVLTGTGTPLQQQQPLRQQPAPSRGSISGSFDNSTSGSPGPRQGLYSGTVPGSHLAGGFAAGISPMRAPPPPPQLYPIHTHPHPHPQQWGASGGLTGSRAGPQVPGIRGTSRRMSDFIGGGSVGGAVQSGGGAAAASLAAVGSSAVVGGPALVAAAAAAVVAAAPPGPVRVRSLVVSESGAGLASLSSGQMTVPQQQPGRVVLPAMSQTPPASAGGAGVGTLGSQSSGDFKAAAAAAAAAAATAGGSQPLLMQSTFAPASGALPPQSPSPPPQQQHMPYHLPYHLQGLLASAMSSPITRSGPQSSPGTSTDDSPALRRRHSFIEQSLGATSNGPKPSPNSFTQGIAGGAAAADSSMSAAAAAAAAAGRTATTGGGGGGGFPAHLPPLLPNQGSVGGSSPGAASPSASPAAAVLSMSPNASAAAPATAGSGAFGDASLGRVARRVSNLAPQSGLSTAAVAAASPPPLGGVAAAAAPPLGLPPCAASPRSFRRLHSLTQANASAAVAGTTSGGSPPAAVSRVMTAGGGSVAAVDAPGAAAAASGGAGPLAPRASLPPPPPPEARSPVAVSTTLGGVLSRAS